MKRIPLLFLLIGISLSAQAQTSLRTGLLFSDNMVLQRGREVPVWGWATPGQTVEVNFSGPLLKTRAGADGRWSVILPALPAGGPFTMQVKSDGETVVIQNILVGDVWLCSGQSNMEWPVANSRDAETEIAAADDPLIRHFKVPLVGADEPQAELPGGDWTVASPETVGNFTAVGYFFARELRKTTGVPIGLINSTWGGSSLEAWTSAEVPMPSEVQQQLEAENEARASALAEVRRALEAQLGSIPAEDVGLAGGWTGPDYDDADWSIMDLPQLWEGAGLTGLDGIVWFRRSFSLSAAAAESGITLGLAKIDDSDRVWINGREVAGTEQAWSLERHYPIDPQYLRAGENALVVRVEDTGGGGGIYGEPGLLYVDSKDGRQSLSGAWRYRIGKFQGSIQKNQVPHFLYNHMIHPMAGYGNKGVIWYQGESNANDEGRALLYREQFPAMIAHWRKIWGQGDFPFLFVQLANFRAPQAEPGNSTWAVLRESQLKTLEKSPNTGQAVIIDIGEADDIHPRNKQDVGYRLALAARKLAYGEDLVYSGPVYSSHEVEGNTIRLRFDHVGGGLIARDKYGYLKGFAIAGEDGKFHWARARIEGDEVVVWSETVPGPVAVRYAWADNPDDVNLYNAEGLPASPFRTDEW